MIFGNKNSKFQTQSKQSIQCATFLEIINNLKTFHVKLLPVYLFCSKQYLFHVKQILLIAFLLFHVKQVQKNERNLADTIRSLSCPGCFYLAVFIIENTVGRKNIGDEAEKRTKTRQKREKNK